MKNVLSVRLDREQLRRIRSLARRDRKEASVVARELMDMGWSYAALREYRRGKTSLGTLAQRLGMSLGDAIDLLAELGVRSPIEYDDYLAAFRAFPKLHRKRGKA